MATQKKMDDSLSNSRILRTVSAVIGWRFAGFDVVQEACDLAVADCRLNWWLASTKDSTEPVIAEQGWMDWLDEIERVTRDVSLAWDAFRTFEQKRGQIEAWTRNSEAFCLALRKARLALDDIGRAQGRTNQRKVSEEPGA